MNDKLLAQVPENARRILDVGCGSGDFGAALKARQECDVTGIELDEETAQQAFTCIDQVVVGDVTHIAPLLPRGHYDAIVLGDVVEHLVDPVPVLEALKLSLAPGGMMLFSVPNVRHWSIVKMLLEGDWVYQAGLVSPGHMRFYTRKSFGRTAARAGLDVKMVDRIDVGDSPIIPLAELIEDWLETGNLVDEATMYQMIFEGESVQAPPFVSIIIPVHNLWKQTKKCLRSIAAHTPQDHEIIVIDNASTDKTRAKLTNRSATQENLIIHHNKGNRSYAAACNQGISEARGEFVVVLNNDVVVTDGWLGKMLSAIERTDAGIVGPVSDYVAGAQHVDYVYKGNGQLADFARRIYYTELSSVLETQAIVGFCMLIRREVFDEIGLFDERFVNGYEESDFCLRAAEAGIKTVIARDTFIHHEGSQTFHETGVDYWALIEENHQKFISKWPGRIPGHIESAQASGWFFRPAPQHLPVFTLAES